MTALCEWDEADQIDQIVFEMLERFAFDMNRDGVLIPVATRAAIQFAAECAAATINFYAGDAEHHARGVQALINEFAKHLKKCMGECPPVEIVPKEKTYAH